MRMGCCANGPFCYSYITEIAPAQRRGMLASMPQLMACTGICLGYFTCYGSVKIGSSFAWRMPFLVMLVASVILAVSSLFMPTSPRWLMFRDRRDEAIRACERLGISRIEIEKDISRLGGSGGNTKNEWEIFHKKYRLRTVLALFILGMVQLSGIDGVIYVSIETTCCRSICQYESKTTWVLHGFVEQL